MVRFFRHVFRMSVTYKIEKYHFDANFLPNSLGTLHHTCPTSIRRCFIQKGHRYKKVLKLKRNSFIIVSFTSCCFEYCNALRDFVPFIQFKKCEKHP